jgi:hypothetical protein
MRWRVIRFGGVSVSNDAKIRNPSEALHNRQSRLLDSIAPAEMQNELQSRVIMVFKAQFTKIEEQTGTKPSLTDEEIKEYLNEILKQIKI